VAGILKVAQGPQQDGVAEVQIGCGGIKAGFDDKGAMEAQLLAQLGFSDHLGCAAEDELKRSGGSHPYRDVSIFSLVDLKRK